MRPVAAALGIPPAVDRLYRQVYAGSGTPVDDVARSLMRTREELLDELAVMIAGGIARVEGDILYVVAPAEALGIMLAQESRKLGETSSRLEALARALPFLGEGSPQADAAADALAIDGEVFTGGNVPQTLVRWIEETSGEMLFLRPDQWRMPSESMMFQATMSAVRSGRVVRAIYPARALEEAPDVLVSRARSGEQIRVVPEVHTRLAIVGTARAMLPDPPGVANDRRLVIRQRGIVEMLVAYFDALWDSAAAIPAPRHRRRPPRPPAPAAHPARRRREGRADRAHPGHEPAHRAPPHPRSDERPGRRHPLRGRRRGRPPRLDLAALRLVLRVDRVARGRQHHGVRRLLDAPRPRPLRPVELAVGRDVERLAARP